MSSPMPRPSFIMEVVEGLFPLNLVRLGRLGKSPRQFHFFLPRFGGFCDMGGSQGFRRNERRRYAFVFSSGLLSLGFCG